MDNCCLPDVGRNTNAAKDIQAQIDISDVLEI